MKFIFIKLGWHISACFEAEHTVLLTASLDFLGHFDF